MLSHSRLVCSDLCRRTKLRAQPTNPSNGASAASPEDEIRAERRKREYLSLFASNVALSYRKDAFNAPPAPKTTGAATGVDSESRLTPVGATSERPATAYPHSTGGGRTIELNTFVANAIRPIGSGQRPDTRAKGGRPTFRLTPSSRNFAVGKTYLIFEGTILETVLINRLDGLFSGPVECLLANDVYSHDRQHLLIPAGTKILGETKKVDTFGQTRLAVVFHRLIMPDGYSTSLDKFKGLDQIGDTGLRDRVNNHYLRIFGTSLAIGALGAVAEAGTGSALTSSSGDLMRQGFAASTAQSAAQILDRFLSILPTVTIREGHRVKVYLSGDLALPDYNHHTMPSDL